MRTRLYWSLICYPLGLALEVTAVVVMLLGHTWPAVGLSVLGGHMLLWQIIWAFVTPRPADIVFTCFCICSSGCLLAVIFGTFFYRCHHLAAHRLRTDAVCRARRRFGLRISISWHDRSHHSLPRYRSVDSDLQQTLATTES